MWYLILFLHYKMEGIHFLKKLLSEMQFNLKLFETRCLLSVVSCLPTNVLVFNAKILLCPFLFIGCVLLCENFHWGCKHSLCQTRHVHWFSMYAFIETSISFLPLFPMSLHRHFLCYITSFLFSIIPIPSFFFISLFVFFSSFPSL